MKAFKDVPPGEIALSTRIMTRRGCERIVRAAFESARKPGIAVYDVDRGIGTHTLIEEGPARPNTTVVGTDSHMNILGAVGSFGQGMGDVDIAFAFRTGMTWFEVPETVKVILKGRPARGTTAKDLTLFLCRELGAKTIALRAAEFSGPAAAGLGLAGRITLCSMVTEMAGIIGFVPETSPSLFAEAAALGMKDFVPSASDPGAAYAEVVELDLKTGRGIGPGWDAAFEIEPMSGVQADIYEAGDLFRCGKSRG